MATGKLSQGIGPLIAETSGGQSNDPPGARGHRPALVLAALLAIYLILEALLPLRTAVQIGADEGFELAKATLCLKGHKLYSEVWNDQPPLHTFLITAVLKHISSSVLGPRLVTVGFAGLLLASIFIFILRVSGLAVATVATALIILSPEFLLLSGSCMLEIPALGPALAGLAFLWCAWKSRWRLPELIAGALFGIAFQMKLVPAVLMPVAALALWLRDSSSGHPLRATILSLCVVGLSLVAMYVTLDLLVERGAYLVHFGQSWRSHFGAAKGVGYGSADQHPFDWSLLLKNWDATLPALVGVGFCISQARTKTRMLLPVAWLCWSLLVFGAHRPWWVWA
jgi:hypothetical protein